MEQYSLWGTIVNSLAIFVASAMVLLFKALISFFKDKRKKKENVRENIFAARAKTLSDVIIKGIAISIAVIGISGAIKTQNILLMILSIVFGSIIGTMLDIDAGIQHLGDIIESKAKKSKGSIAEGFVNASLICCVGAMAVVGSLESGLRLDHSTLYSKSLLDFFIVIVLTATMGAGVCLSSLSVFVFQGTITVFAGFLAPILSDAVINEISAVGSVLIIALSLNLLGLTKIKTMNYLPAVFIPIVLYAII